MRPPRTVAILALSKRLVSIEAQADLTGLLGTGQALKATILADTNRDGKVDVRGSTDLLGKESWSESSGALFLANIADSDRRCSSKITDNTTNSELDACNDASDDIQRNPKYLAPVLTLPNPKLSDSATGSVAVIDATSNVRIFHWQGSDWAYVRSNHTFSARHLRDGLTLGVDARQVRTPDWDGRATIEFTIRDGTEEARDIVVLRVAPVLTHHHCQQADQLFATAGSDGSVQGKFVEDLARISAKAGIEKALFEINTTDVWAQDFFEPGYTSIPGPDGPVVLRIMIRSAQQDGRRTSGRVVYRDLRSDTVGAVQHHVHGGSIDSLGNLETIPPHSHGGRSYPAGRVIMGSRSGTKPLLVSFLDAQEVQVPVEIDTTWLRVGHTDEIMQFLPADNDRGWVMMIADPMMGLELLQRAQQDGHGAVRGLSRPAQSNDGEWKCLPTETIDDILGKANFSRVQEYSARMIEASVEAVKHETGITDAHIMGVPALFAEAQQLLSCEPPTKRHGQQTSFLSHRRLSILEAADPRPGVIRRQALEFEVSAFYPGAINGVVLSRSQYVAPNPWGPVFGGRDIFAEAVSRAYERAGFNVTYMDDYFSHHRGLGEVHCGSNTVRDASGQWW